MGLMTMPIKYYGTVPRRHGTVLGRFDAAAINIKVIRKQSLGAAIGTVGALGTVFSGFPIMRLPVCALLLLPILLSQPSQPSHYFP